ncbi:hypothetical protein [Salidesulfovibrio onnuriiensis]|uniref:hypothetical protein n=1 Tax=Salidesulfovibrio onnuriiensis TaxID=2583823 RepID=UPI0011C88C75|nr:hypothetical protein [Salidesulfovibrio onnuriiensis]
MKWSTLRNCALIATTVLPLSGCLVLSALLGASGFVLTGPAQYIGTVYTVGEYTYELAANNKTPDMVIKEKLAWFIGPDTDRNKAEEPQTTLLAEQNTPAAPLKTLRIAPLPSPTLETAPEPIIMEVAMLGTTELPRQKSHPANITPERTHFEKSFVKHSPEKKVELQTRAAKIRPPLPLRSAKTPPPDTLLRIQRMEQSFRAADMHLTGRTDGNGVRIEMPPDLRPDGINGSWSIRHQVS